MKYNRQFAQKLKATFSTEAINLNFGYACKCKIRLMQQEEKILLRKRSLIETVDYTLKMSARIEHSCHRSPINSLAHLIKESTISVL